MVESLFGAVSRGTERLVFEGRVPPSEHERMRAPHQEGAFRFPVKYGYAVVGRVVSGPPDLEGRLVFALHPHQDRFTVAAADLVPLPPAVPPERAVLAANMETALNIVWDAGIQPGDRVAVVGAGLVGLLVASLAATMPAVSVAVVDVDLSRREVAEALGAAFAPPGEADGECDVVVHASASAAGLAEAIDLCGFEGRVVEASWYGEGAVPVPLGGAFHARRLSLVASQVGHLPANRRARWTHRRRLETALDLVGADHRLDRLFSGETLFTELAADYPRILESSRTLCHRIRYR